MQVKYKEYEQLTEIIYNEVVALQQILKNGIHVFETYETISLMPDQPAAPQPKQSVKYSAQNRILQQLKDLVPLLSEFSSEPDDIWNLDELKDNVDHCMKTFNSSLNAGLWHGDAYDTLCNRCIESCERISNGLDELMTIAEQSEESHQESMNFDETAKTLCCISRIINRKPKTISIIHGNLLKLSDQYDAMVISAFQNGYSPTPGTMIGALSHQGISIKDLAEHPALNLKSDGVWASGPISDSFGRIICVEIRDFEEYRNSKKVTGNLLTEIFATLKYALEKMELRGISIRRICMPILGAGRQQMDASFIAVPLITQCLKAFSNVDSLEAIDIYDISEKKIRLLAETATKVFEEKKDSDPDIFISYSKCESLAQHLRDELRKYDFNCFYAPESIRMGSDYLKVIPVAIGKAKAILLLLNAASMESKWVDKEIILATDSGKSIIPLKIEECTLTVPFGFLLANTQIVDFKDDNEKDRLDEIAKIVNKLITEQNTENPK